MSENFTERCYHHLHGNATINSSGPQSSSSSGNAYKDFINQLNIYLIPIIIIVGVFGNGISFMVFIGTHLRRQSSSIYLAGLAIADVSFLLALFVGWFSWLRIHLFHRNVWCQVVVYVTYVGSFLSVWCVVCFTAERFIIVSYPFKRQTLCTVKNARTVLVTISLFALTSFSFPLWTSGIVLYNGLPYCTVLPQYRRAIFVITAIDTVITLLLPSLIIIALNVRITLLVYRFNKKRETLRCAQLNLRKCSNCEDHLECFCMDKNDCETRPTHPVPIRELRRSSHRSLVQMKITRMLLVVSTTFILLNLPSHVVRIKSFVESFRQSESSHSGIEMHFQQLSQFIHYLSFSINFFLYSLCGRNFKRCLYRLLSKGRYNVQRTCSYVHLTSCRRRRRSPRHQHVSFGHMSHFDNV